jgi:hypothetical protein
MSTSPLNPVFGDPASGIDRFHRSPTPIYQLPNGSAGPGAAGNIPATDAANDEIRSIAAAIQELQGRLERANSQLGQANTVQTTEIEIGRLFVEAQRFSEESISKLELQIQEILIEAEMKATQILREATDEALEIRRQAQDSAYVSAKTAQELQAAIAGFTVVNSALVDELSSLNSMLSPTSDAKVTPLDPSARSMRNG